MQKLYKRDKEQLRYYEAWADGRAVTVHWGIVGERGESKEIKISKGAKADAEVDKALAAARAQGFAPFDEEKERRLIVEYRVDGFVGDLDKRRRLEDRLGETLGWTGLGHCDGGSIGSGTMEVCCFVVDFKIACAVVIADLKGSEFSDFTRIYDEDSDESVPHAPDMDWKLSSECDADLPLPPTAAFAETFKGLDPAANSFYVLEKSGDYIQCGGSCDRCAVELREHGADGSFRHGVFRRLSGSDKAAHIPMSAGGVMRQEKHCLTSVMAAQLFDCFYTGKSWPESLALDDITDTFD
ncbi:MAG: hypothetical protein LBV49_01760 [Azonexus sp.]|nr:hypothetical protein [Azonexus sp.]